ncbi:MAG TPA: cytochrome c peroxidase [Bacteriovoracaceae bacterium]|nr:cytochrome c peroxidase [Bacteriovoracaceae bacterium]
MKNLILLFATLSLITFTQNLKARTELDERLEGYIKSFNLKPLAEPAPVNMKLFRLGREFFFEKRISGNKNISCAECHHPMAMTHDGLPLGLGEGSQGIEISPGGRQQKTGKLLARNSTALLNLHNVPSMFWDGRVHLDSVTGKFTTPTPLPTEFVSVLGSALAAQALFPMVNHEEMRGAKGSNEIADAADDKAAWAAIFARIMNIPEYVSKLKEVFPGEELNLAHVAHAIAHFETQAFSAGDTAYDSFLKGERGALTEIQKIGMDVFFGKGKCGECHKGEHLSDFSFHNVGIPQIGPGKINGDDFGRYEWDSTPENLYAFKVPGLRNASVTAPYMHNGAFKTLAQVIEHYDDIEGSLKDFIFVNNYRSYIEKISGPLHETDDAKLASLSTKLTKKLLFEESEEKALAEFIRGGLTEKRFLNAEIDDEYITNLRIQLTEEGYKKIFASIPDEARNRQAKYYYFDVLTSEGYGLRELEKPIKIYFTETEGKTVLTYRKKIFKSSGSVSGLIAGGTFEDEELLSLSPDEARLLSDLNHDFYSRLYVESIPRMEKEILKQDVLQMNGLWHKLKLKSVETMSNELNFPKDDIFFAPTSMNTKDEYLWTKKAGEHEITYLLQHSRIRTEAGGIVSTWAIDLKLAKITKKQLPEVLNQWLKELTDMGLEASDGNGTSPSPSKLTEKVLLEIF